MTSVQTTPWQNYIIDYPANLTSGSIVVEENSLGYVDVVADSGGIIFDSNSFIWFNVWESPYPRPTFPLIPPRPSPPDTTILAFTEANLNPLILPLLGALAGWLIKTYWRKFLGLPKAEKVSYGNILQRAVVDKLAKHIVLPLEKRKEIVI